MTTRTFTVGLAQRPANPTNEDRLDDAVAAIVEAAGAGAQIVVLPELFRHRYFCQEMTPDHFALAEPADGPTLAALAPVARAHDVVVVASIFEHVAPGLCFNTALVIDADGTLLGRYRKQHIPDDPLFYEKFYFTPGDEGCAVFETRYARIGVLICWDQWFPEAARLTAMKGAELIVYPTAIGTIDDEGPAEHARQMDAWQTVQRGHAIANGVYVAAVNRVGREQDLTFTGGSFACGPQGELLAVASGGTAETAIVTCDRDRIRDVREIWPFFRDRRIDTFGDLTKRWSK